MLGTDRRRTFRFETNDAVICAGCGHNYPTSRAVTVPPQLALLHYTHTHTYHLLRPVAEPKVQLSLVNVHSSKPALFTGICSEAEPTIRLAIVTGDEVVQRPRAQGSHKALTSEKHTAWLVLLLKRRCTPMRVEWIDSVCLNLSLGSRHFETDCVSQVLTRRPPSRRHP